MCSWVSVVAKVNGQETSGFKKAKNCKGQCLGVLGESSTSVILKF